MLAAATAAYFLAWLIIPGRYISRFAGVKYGFLIIEGAFIMVKLTIAITIVKQIPVVMRRMKNDSYVQPYFHNRLARASSR